MIKYEIDEGCISKLDKEVCTKLATEFTSLVQGMQKDAYPELVIGLDYRVVQAMKDAIVLTHNVQLMDRKGYELINDLDRIVEKEVKPVANFNGYTFSIFVDVKHVESIKNGIMAEKAGINNQIKGNNKASKVDDTETQSFISIDPLYSFDQVILDQSIIDEIESALQSIECRDLIYHEWGFIDVEPAPKSILNFYGEPGTGKTMCAHAVAKRLGKKLLALKYSEIESKYLGDATKNLKRAFDTATETDAVIFFDEADSFLGKRIENVNHGSEQALNSLRSQMLIMLESFSGVVIFATNLVTNYDRAFESRILKHIKFSLPNKDARALIIRKMTPAKLPLERELTDSEIMEVSEIAEGLAGREIKNAMLDMLLTKAYQRTECGSITFTIDDYKKAFTKRKSQIEQLKKEENERLKLKITKKLQEKAEEAKAEREAEELNSSSETSCNNTETNNGTN